MIDAFGDTDTLISIERINGTPYADSITGSDVNNSLSGFDGNDTLIGGAGGDNLEPGTGDDSVVGGARGPNGEWNELSYIWDSFDAGASGGLTVTFTSEFGGTVNDYGGDTDTFSDIDRVLGTMNADSFTGNAGRQVFAGFAGDDTFNGGASDRDRVDYSPSGWDASLGASQGVNVNLASGTATDAFGDTDSLTGIEEIRGTDRDDTILGDGNDNRLEGEGGNDSLEGGAGNDNLSGGDGNDTLVGGNDGDWIEPGAGSDVINAGNGGNDWWDELVYQWDSFFYSGPTQGMTITFTSELDGNVSDFTGATDVFTGIEKVMGSMLGDTFIGAAGNQIFEGYAGDDTFNGGDGDRDFIDYRKSGGDMTELGAFQGVEVDIAAGEATDPFGHNDTLINIEGIRGTHWDDFIAGDGLFNELRGYEGNDLLLGGALDQGFDPFAFQAFRLYQATLDRAPDIPGLVGWANGLANGLTIGQAASGFVNSSEFQSKYGAADSTLR